MFKALAIFFGGLIMADIELMYWLAWKWGFVARVIMASSMVAHVILFFGTCYIHLLK